MGHYTMCVIIPPWAVKRGPQAMARYVERRMHPYKEAVEDLRPHKRYFWPGEVESLAEEYGGSPDDLHGLAKRIPIDVNGGVSTDQETMARGVLRVGADKGGLYSINTGNEGQAFWDYWMYGIYYRPYVGTLCGDWVFADEYFHRWSELDRMRANVTPLANVVKMMKARTWTHNWLEQILGPDVPHGSYQSNLGYFRRLPQDSYFALLQYHSI